MILSWINRKGITLTHLNIKQVGHVLLVWMTTISSNHRAYSHDVTVAILVLQNNETAATLVYQDNPVGIELFFYVKTFFCSYWLAKMLATWVNRLYTIANTLRSKDATAARTSKNNRFNKQNNFAHLSHFFVHFFAVFACLRRENA